jgi:hypothetical protein
MKMEQWIRAIAGTLILISLGLGYFYNPYWYIFTAFVGLNLLQSAFTKWCLMEDILAKFGVSKGSLKAKNPGSTGGPTGRNLTSGPCSGGCRPLAAPGFFCGTPR